MYFVRCYAVPCWHRQARSSFHFMPLHDGTLEAMEKGRIDLVLNGDDGYAPAHLVKEAIFGVEFVCVVAKKAASHVLSH